MHSVWAFLNLFIPACQRLLMVISPAAMTVSLMAVRVGGSASHDMPAYAESMQKNCDSQKNSRQNTGNG